jgi:Leucine-rich repeat (LRR) protein
MQISSKFHGFTNQNPEIISQNSLKIKHDQFLDYDYTLPSNPKQLQNQTVEPNDDNSSLESDQTVTIDITLLNSQVYIKIYQIISSINTTNLTANYFPNNFKYNQLEEIELSFNHITYLNAHTFRYLKQFQGKLILSNNQIKYLDPYSLADLSLIKNLSLAKNFIQNLTSKHFQELNQLEELNLSYNQIYQLNNNTFEYLTNLQILYLNFNPIEFIHADTFLNLTQLKQIHFQGVQFTHSIDQVYFQWIWNLASLHVIHLLKTE